MASVTIEQWKGIGGQDDSVVPTPCGKLTGELFATNGSNVSAAIRKDCGLLVLTSDVDTNVTWDYTATPGQATTADTILKAGVSRYFDPEAHKGNGTMTLGFRHSA